MVPFALLLAAVWGVVWALFLELAPVGRWMAARRTWLTVVIGVGADLLILLIVLPLEMWWMVAAVVGCSAAGIVARSLRREFADHVELVGGLKDAAGE